MRLIVKKIIIIIFIRGIQNRTGLDRTEEDWTGQERTGVKRTGLE